jgi:hypothetical protein
MMEEHVQSLPDDYEPPNEPGVDKSYVFSADKREQMAMDVSEQLNVTGCDYASDFST